MMKHKKLMYWIAQLSGWGIYMAFAAIVVYLAGNLNAQSIKLMIVTYILGILTTHLYRGVIIKLGWLSMRFWKLVPRVLLAAVIYALVFHLTDVLLLKVLFNVDIFNTQDFFQQTFNWILICIVWSSIYIGFHFFTTFRQQEIKNLRLEAANREAELSNLKSQLNPHFMFNSMNSIRALINEDPEEAKDAVTLLSNILRNTLILGRKKKVMLEEELDVIRDYLRLEGVRFEERLKVGYEVDEDALSCYIPPLMLQTIVENAIKHGIGQLPQGGSIKINVGLNGDQLIMKVVNDGRLQQNSLNGTGIGLQNTRKRLSLMYGENASVEISESNQKVYTQITLPKQIEI